MEVVKDIVTEKRWKYKQDAKRLGLKSAVCIPITADGQSRGVLTGLTQRSRNPQISKPLKIFWNLLFPKIGASIETHGRQIALQKLLEIGQKINSLKISEDYSAILKYDCQQCERQYWTRIWLIFMFIMMMKIG